MQGPTALRLALVPEHEKGLPEPDGRREPHGSCKQRAGGGAKPTRGLRHGTLPRLARLKNRRACILS
jgi:hypothetical protein